MTSEKIAIMGGNMFGRWIGGVGRLCIELALLLRDKDYAISLITNCPSVKNRVCQDFECYFLPNQIYDPSNFPRLISVLKKQNPDVIHIHAQIGAIPITVLLRKILKKPVVYTPVTLYPRMASPSYHIERVVPLKHKVLGACALDNIVCQSSYGRRFLIQQGLPSEKIGFVAYGLRSDFLKPISDSFQLPENTVLFWTFGSRERSFDLLLSAIPEVVKEIKGVQFVLALINVEKDLQHRLFSLKEKTGKITIAERLGLSDNYRVNLGSETFELPLAQLIAASDLVVLPYRTNPQEPPISLVETMALGAPTITSRLGANVELFNHHSSLLIPPDDPKKLASAIVNALLHRKVCRKWAFQLREFITKRYDRNIALSSISKVYEESMRGR